MIVYTSTIFEFHRINPNCMNHNNSKAYNGGPDEFHWNEGWCYEVNKACKEVNCPLLKKQEGH